MGYLNSFGNPKNPILFVYWMHVGANWKYIHNYFLLKRTCFMILLVTTLTCRSLCPSIKHSTTKKCVIWLQQPSASEINRCTQSLTEKHWCLKHSKKLFWQFSVKETWQNCQCHWSSLTVIIQTSTALLHLKVKGKTQLDLTEVKVLLFLK